MKIIGMCQIESGFYIILLSSDSYIIHFNEFDRKR